MGKLSGKAFRPQPVMNVTPLVDVVLVLLIIFMIIIPMMEKSAKVDLPTIFNADPDPKGKTDPFTLSLTADGSMHFEQQELDEDKFNEALRAANTREPGRRLVVRADWAAKYSDVRKLFKACQGVGFPGVSLRVNEAKGPGTKP
jgi:biopolymer transport protein TolR